MTKTKILIDPRKISKLCFLLYIVYANVASYSLFFVKGLSSVLLIGALLTELWSDGFKLHTNRSFIAFVIFTLYVLGSGLLVAVSYDTVFSTAMPFLESLLVFYLTVSYAMYDKNTCFVMNVFIAQALLAAIVVIFNGVGKQRLSIADSVNVNTIGVMLAYAIGFILYMLIREKQKPLILVVGISCIAVLFIGILLAVSKKGIFTAVTVVLVWVLLCYRFTIKKLNGIYKILIFAAIIAIAVFTVGWFTTNYTFQVQILKTRMSQLYSGDSDQDRIRLFLEGFTIFFNHPIMGVGFNNSRFYSFRSTYTHSLYSELFACTGIIGVFIFSYGLFRPFHQIFKYITRYHDRYDIDHIRRVYVWVLYVVLLVLGLVQIVFYQPTLMYVLGVLTAFAAVLPNPSDKAEN